MSEKSKNKEAEKVDEEIIERTAPPGRVVYEAIYREGEHEMDRRIGALAWSGMAAGLSMGFSCLMEGILRDYTPKTYGQPALAKLGYIIGFIIVFLGLQQIFTKNTLSVSLPLLKENKMSQFKKVARLWAVVLLMNLLGASAFAFVLSHTGVCSESVRVQLSSMGEEVLKHSFLISFLRAILAGWLVALMIWLMPFAESAHFWVIALLAYLLGIAHLPHVVAGSVPSLYAVFTGAGSWGQWLGSFFLPALLGNCIGGVAMVAIGAHVEFVKESPHPEKGH